MSDSRCDYSPQGAVAVLRLSSPPVNGLGHALRRGIVEGIDRANADAAMKAIVLIGSEKVFSGGADIREFHTPAMTAAPSLHDVIAAVEASAKPVIAAIGGVAMGGGLELALACHFRIALRATNVALPEVKLGLLPGAGGTQRLPRVIGAEAALNMIVSGATVPADKFAGTPLFQRLLDADLEADAQAFAAEVIDGKHTATLVRDLPAKLDDPDAYFQFARNTIKAVAGPYPAPLRCLDCVEAAFKQPFAQGLETERKLFTELLYSSESAALRHAFFGERACAKIADVPADTPTRPINQAAVIGAGTMGGGIAMNFANAGIPVVMLEMKQEALDKGLGVIRGNYERSAAKGKLKPEQVEQRMGLIRGTLSYEELKDADIIIEAVFEEMSVKQQVFEQLDAVAKPGAILATNTSTLDVDQIASFTQRPSDVVGTHFFSPANVMRLLEVVRGEKTAKDVLATVMQLGKTIRKLAVVSGVCDGFIGNRMINKYSAESLVLLAEGALPDQVDGAMEKFGMAMGPFRMGDLAGNDVGWFIRKRHYAEFPDMPKAVIADRLCELGRFGQKTGAGWYRYVKGDRKAHPDPEVEKLIVDYRAEAGITPRKISDQEIVERLVYALVNEGARILEEGIAQRASDIDMVYLNGYGFPPYRGGPMHYADQVGLYNVARKCRQFAANPLSDSAFWEPAALLTQLAEAGKTFN